MRAQVATQKSLDCAGLSQGRAARARLGSRVSLPKPSLTPILRSWSSPGWYVGVDPSKRSGVSDNVAKPRRRRSCSQSRSRSRSHSRLRSLTQRCSKPPRTSTSRPSAPCSISSSRRVSLVGWPDPLRSGRGRGVILPHLSSSSCLPPYPLLPSDLLVAIPSTFLHIP
jgi:hypothetical protein